MRWPAACSVARERRFPPASRPRCRALLTWPERGPNVGGPPLESVGHRHRSSARSFSPFFRLAPSGSKIPAQHKADRIHCLHAAAGATPCETRLSPDPIRLSQVILSSLPSFIVVYEPQLISTSTTFRHKVVATHRPVWLPRAYVTLRSEFVFAELRQEVFEGKRTFFGFHSA